MIYTLPYEICFFFYFLVIFPWLNFLCLCWDLEKNIILLVYANKTQKKFLMGQT